MTEIDAIVLVLLLVLPVGDMIATAFFFSLFRQSKRTPAPKPGGEEIANRPRLWGGPVLLGGRSWLLGLMTLSWTIITLVCIVIGFLSGRRLLGSPPLEQGAMIQALALILLALIPIVFTLAFWSARRRRGGPPPFGEGD